VLCLDDGPRAWDGVSLIIEERLDVEHGLDIATAIEALTCAALMRLQLGKLALPEAQNIGRHIAEARDFADAKVKFVRNFRRTGWWGVFANWLVLRHAKKLQGADWTLPSV
jgi:hypothetical protein